MQTSRREAHPAPSNRSLSKDGGRDVTNTTRTLMTLEGKERPSDLTDIQPRFVDETAALIHCSVPG